MSSQYMLSIIIDVMGAIVGNRGRVLDMTWDWREKEAHFMQSNKGQRCDLCGKGEAKTRDKDASLQINNVQALCSFCNAKCKKQIVQIVQIVQCKTTASMSEVIIMFQDNWQSKSDRKKQMGEE